jgi:hypothetical protein
LNGRGGSRPFLCTLIFYNLSNSVKRKFLQKTWETNEYSNLTVRITTKKEIFHLASK